MAAGLAGSEPKIKKFRTLNLGRKAFERLCDLKISQKIRKISLILTNQTRSLKRQNLNKTNFPSGSAIKPESIIVFWQLVLRVPYLECVGYSAGESTWSRPEYRVL